METRVQRVDKCYLSVDSRYTLGNMFVNLKIVAVGDVGVGKTTLLYAIMEDRFVAQVWPIGGNSGTASATTPDGKVLIRYAFWDEHCYEEYDRLRPLSYPNTDVFLVCFSTVVPKSLERVCEKMIPEIMHHCPGTPFLLVGTQLDLKEDRATIDKLASKNQAPISSGVGLETAKQVGAAQYLECSSLTLEGVKNVIKQAILEGLNFRTPEALKRAEKREKKKTCIIS